jgi:hypothetical protein
MIFNLNRFFIFLPWVIVVKLLNDYNRDITIIQSKLYSLSYNCDYLFTKLEMMEEDAKKHVIPHENDNNSCLLFVEDTDYEMLQRHV